MLRLEGRHGACFIDPEKVVAIEAWDICGKELEFRGTRILVSGGEVIVNGDVELVFDYIKLRGDA